MADVVDVRVNLKDVEDGIAAMKAAAGEMRRVMVALKPFARKDQESHAIARMSSTGPWPARARTTLDKVEKRSRLVVVKTQTTRRKRNAAGNLTGGAKIVTRKRATEPLGSIPKSVRLRARADELIGDSTIGWAGAHNKGATVGRGSRIPMREFLWWSPPFVELAVNAIEDYVIIPWKKGGVAFRVRPGARPSY